MEALEKASYGVGLTSAFRDGGSPGEEALADILVSESHQGVFTPQHGGKQRQVVLISAGLKTR